MRLLLATLGRDLRARIRQPADVLNPLVFYLLVISLFPLGLGPDKETLRMIAPGVLWVAALLSTLMSLDMLFRSDYEEGTLEQAALSVYPMSLVVLGKVAAHWLAIGLPLVALAPTLGLFYYLDTQALQGLGLSLLLATPSLSLLGAAAAALTLGLPRGGLLVAILVLPLYVPVLIFATTLVAAATSGSDYSWQLYVLLAILFASMAISPLIATAGLRVSLGR